MVKGTDYIHILRAENNNDYLHLAGKLYTAGYTLLDYDNLYIVKQHYREIGFAEIAIPKISNTVHDNRYVILLYKVLPDIKCVYSFYEI